MKLTWDKFLQLCEELARKIQSSLIESGNEDKYSGVYGIPRGGSLIALELSRALGVPIIDNDPAGSGRRDILVVDDICDSGKTLSRYPGQDRATLLCSKQQSEPNSTTMNSPNAYYYVADKTEWVTFPYESLEKPAQDGVVRILQGIGEDPSREGLVDTPNRVVKSWERIYGGYSQKPEDILKVTFKEDMNEYDQLVTLTDIELFSMCEHHMLPFYGKAHVGYIPNGKVVGLSKLARLVEVYSRRLQIQERMTMEIANAIQEHLQPQGVGVVIQAKHLCMMARGVEKQNSVMTTSCMLGCMREESKEEFLKLCIK